MRFTPILFICSFFYVSSIARAADVHFAHLMLTKKYSAAPSADFVQSIVLDNKDAVAYVVGETTSPRGITTPTQSFFAAAQTTVKSTLYTQDAVVAKISKDKGQPMWATRLTEQYPTQFSVVAISPDKSTVYAAGIYQKGSGKKALIVQVFDPKTGGLIGGLLESPHVGFTNIHDILAHDDGIYLCGHMTSSTGDSLDTSNSTTGGFTIVKISKKASSSGMGVEWIKRGGENLYRDYCRALALSQDKKSLYALGVLSKVKSSGSLQESALLYKMDASKGTMVWDRKIQNTAELDVSTSSLTSTESAIFFSARVTADKITRGRMYVYKLSIGAGTLLWAREVCCGNILYREPALPNFPQRGDAGLTSRIYFAEDRYLYQVGYYQRMEKSAYNKYAVIVARIGEYAEFDVTKDVSAVPAYFELEPSRPLKTGFCWHYDMHAAYVVSNNVTKTKGGGELGIPQLDIFTFEKSFSKVASVESTGKFQVRVVMRIKFSGVTADEVGDVVLEKLRLSPTKSDMKLTPTKDDKPERREVVLQLHVAGAKSKQKVAKNAKQSMKALFAEQNGTRSNAIEIHFNLKPWSIVLEQGVVIGDRSESILHDYNPNPGRGLDGLENRQTFSWKIFGVTIGAVGGVAVLIASAMFIIRKRTGSSTTGGSFNDEERDARQRGESIGVTAAGQGHAPEA